METGSGFRLRRTISRRIQDEPDKSYKYFNNSPIKSAAAPEHATVSGALALVLRIARVVGIAPLEMQELARDAWEIRYSKTAFIYSVVMISIMNILAITSVSLDVMVGREHSVHLRTPTKSVVWMIDFTAVTVTANFAVYKAPATMQSMIGALSRIQKICSDINYSIVSSHIEKRLKIMVVVVVSLTIVIFVADYFVVTGFSAQNRRNSIIIYLSSAYYCLYFNLIIITLQFGLSVLIMNSGLKAINEQLEHLCNTVKNEGFQTVDDNTIIERHEIPLGITVPIKSINVVIDKMTSITDIILPKKKSAAETIRILGLHYLDVCELIKGVNRCYGVIALMELLTVFVHLILTPYHLLTALFIKPVPDRITLLQIAWCIRHVSTMLILVEPCHRTFQELNRTRSLLVHLGSSSATAIGPFAVELRKLFWCISLNKMLYAPMGVCTLTRPIVASIVGAVTTYLVFLIQFNTKDDVTDHHS